MGFWFGGLVLVVESVRNPDASTSDAGLVYSGLVPSNGRIRGLSRDPTHDPNREPNTTVNPSLGLGFGLTG